ncbi:MAG: helix-turn-helix domain-containing protein [Ruminococcus sp.]|nr:helix-turn-helix domain-containing protein [Ruminococcus sp.]
MCYTILYIGGVYIKIYTTKEVGRILNLGKNATYKLMNSKSFPSYRINRKLFVSEEDLYKWIDTIKGREIKI